MSQYDGYLQSVMGHYKYSDQARRCIVPVLQQFSDLRPTMESFTFPNGNTQTLLALGGTIPVVHRGSTYQIPVCLYMPLGIPYDAPLVYVKPTANMQIRTSRNVDSNGRITVPYLSSWTHPQSDLVSLVQMLQIQFGEDTPLVSTARQQPQQHHQQQQPHNQQQRQPAGYAWGSGYGWQQQQQQPPPPPPQHQQQYPYSQPQYPQYPPQQQQHQQQPQGTRQDFNEEALRLSVQSAAEEKLRSRYRERRSQLQAELDGVLRTSQDLNEGQSKLQALVGGLEEEKARLQAYIAALNEKNAETEELLAQMQTQEQAPVDEAVDATAPLYRQIVRCFAEEQALEDTIYALGDALKRGSVGIDDYLKNVRELSRQQFLLRATVQAARTKAGLPEL